MIPIVVEREYGPITKNLYRKLAIAYNNNLVLEDNMKIENMFKMQLTHINLIDLFILLYLQEEDVIEIYDIKTKHVTSNESLDYLFNEYNVQTEYRNLYNSLEKEVADKNHIMSYSFSVTFVYTIKANIGNTTYSSYLLELTQGRCYDIDSTEYSFENGVTLKYKETLDEDEAKTLVDDYCIRSFMKIYFKYVDMLMKDILDCKVNEDIINKVMLKPLSLNVYPLGYLPIDSNDKIDLYKKIAYPVSNLSDEFIKYRIATKLSDVFNIMECSALQDLTNIPLILKSIAVNNHLKKDLTTITKGMDLYQLLISTTCLSDIFNADITANDNTFADKNIHPDSIYSKVAYIDSKLRTILC